MSKTATFPYDPVDFLETEDDVVAYLNAAVEDGDPQLVMHALQAIARLRQAVPKAGTALAPDLERARAALAHDNPIQLGPVLAAIKALGLKLQVAR